MKDFVLTAKRQRKEIRIYLICFMLAFALNIFAILFYQTEWKELLTQIFWVLALSIGFYILSVVIRFPFYLRRKKKV